MSGLPSALQQAIGDLQRMLGQDDYTITADLVDDQTLDMAVDARDHACAECIVPKEVLRSIADDSLAPTGFHVRQLTYPGEAPADV